MADHLSDEEQLEALKRWWKANGTSLLVAIMLVAGGWFGWGYWQDRQQQHAEQASAVYIAMLEAVNQWEQDNSAEKAAAVASQAETLKKLGENSRYGQYAAMTIARLAAAEGDLDNAASELEWVLAHSEEAALNGLVTLRLAAIEYGRDDKDRALALLNKPHPASYNSLYEELKGDIFAASGDASKATAAYQSALNSLDENDSRAKAMLELKMNELMPVVEDAVTAGKEDA